MEREADEFASFLLMPINDFRQQVAAWMPDGTRLGPVSLTGGPETPRAADRIGRALRDASGNSTLTADWAAPGSQPTDRSEP